jgi:flagellar protein FliL
MATSTTSRVATDSSSSSAKSGKDGGGSNGSGGDAAPKKSKKKLIIMSVVGLLVVGLGAKMTVLKPKPTAAALAEAKAVKPPEFGPIVPLDEQTVNLADGHYLKVKVVIQLKLKAKAPVAAADGTTTPELSAADNAVIDVYGSFTQPQLTGAANQAKADAALVKKLTPIYPGIIDHVVKTEFLMSS